MMTTAAAVVAEEPPLHYLNESYGVRSWLLTTDHKRVGLLYLISLTGAFFVGGFPDFMRGVEVHCSDDEADEDVGPDRGVAGGDQTGPDDADGYGTQDTCSSGAPVGSGS